jgi:nucleoside-diphosphate-sugar epimerase
VPPRLPSPRVRLPIAVTGATGFLGGHICDALADAGHAIRGVVRDPAKGARLAAEGVDLAKADLADADALRSALDGCGALVANAALGSWAGPIERYLDVNVGGTERLLRASAAAGVKRVVLVSTVAVYRTRLRRWMDEDAEPYGLQRRWLNPSDLTTDWRYALSKALGESRAHALADELGLALTVLRPGPIFGPRDPKLTQRYLRLHARDWAVAPTVGVPQVSARDCADAVPAALARPQSIGRAYNLAGPPTSIVDVLTTLRRLTGRGPRVLRIPLPLWVGYDTRRAHAELGFRARPLEQTLAEVVAAELPGAAPPHGDAAPR